MQVEEQARGDGAGTDGLEGADAAEADGATLLGTTEDADEAADAEAVSEDELMASDNEEDDVQARSYLTREATRFKQLHMRVEWTRFLSLPSLQICSPQI